MSTPVSLRVAVLTPPDVEYFRGVAGYRVRFEVIEAVGMPTHIFVHRVSRHDETMHEFHGTAGPHDLVALPDASPGIGGEKFRKDHADFLITSIASYEQVVSYVNEGLGNLVTSLVKLQQLTQVAELTY
jgi:hypothetical protein